MAEKDRQTPEIRRSAVTEQPGSPTSKPDSPAAALATGLEIAKNAVRARTVDDLQFVLVNDTRALLEFDRSLLIVHLEGKSEFVAVNNQPRLETKSDFTDRVNDLAPQLKIADKAAVLIRNTDKASGLADEADAALRSFMEYSGSSYLVLVPLMTRDSVIGHLMFELFGQTRPREVDLLALMNMVPFLSSALAEKWFLERGGLPASSYRALITGSSGAGKRRKGAAKVILTILAAVAAVFLLTSPVDLTIGGTAEVAPKDTHYAFVQMDGIVEQVFVEEGDRVTEGQVLAVLDSVKLEHDLRKARRMVDSYATEIKILRGLGAEDPKKLAESKIVAVKQQRAALELEFLNWQKQFLEIRAPSDGIVLTKQPESFTGKRFKGGEPFCELAPHDELLLDIFVREADIAYVKTGQPAKALLNYRPNERLKLTVSEIAPNAEPKEGLGNVFRVRSTFLNRPSELKPGMQGIGRITAGEVSAWFFVTRRIRTKINELMLLY
jgi:multidrug resistance efflux pump